MNKIIENISDSEKLKSANSQEKDYFIIKWDFKDKFFCSEKFEDLTGFSSREINNFPYRHHSLLNDCDAKSFHESITDHFKISNNRVVNDIEITTKDGRNIWLREFINLNYSDDEAFYESVLFNITDFKTNEIELNETIEAKTKLNSSKDKLISIISHDLRAPFSSLLGFSEILLNEPNLEESERSEYLKYIYDASTIQLQMVNNLLDWTRLQAGTMKFKPQQLDIKDIVENCVSVLTGSSIRKDIEIKVTGDSGLLVEADERLIGQVVTNLLSNAIKFTPAGKTITVSIELFKDSMIEVIVIDEGIGIDESNKKKLFKIDAKFSKVGTNGEKGSGYGLALVKEIVEKHNGNIWFYSELNKGSEFHFTLPRSENTFLIIEEYEDLKKPYEHLVKEKYNNFSLVFSNNAFEAHNKILENTPSVLITYHDMPLMNGIQLVSALRKKDVHNKVLVIIIGDDLSDHIKESYIDLNVNHFVPINSTIEDIDRILSSHLT